MGTLKIVGLVCSSLSVLMSLIGFYMRHKYPKKTGWGIQ